MDKANIFLQVLDPEPAKLDNMQLRRMNTSPIIHVNVEPCLPFLTITKIAMALSVQLTGARNSSFFH